MIRSNKLVFLTTGSPKKISTSVRHQPYTKRQIFDDLQIDVLERELLMNPNPTVDHIRNIALQISVDKKRVKVKYFI